MTVDNVITDVLVFCTHLKGMDDTSCHRIVNYEKKFDVKGQLADIIHQWRHKATKPLWKDFIRAIALSEKCKVAKRLTARHSVNFDEQTDGEVIKRCKDINSH